MHPAEQSDFINSKTLTRSCQRGMLSSESDTNEDDDYSDTQFAQASVLQELIHVALKVRRDLLDTTGHISRWQGIDQYPVDHVIPNSLYLFLCLLFGGIDMVHEGIEEDNNAVKPTMCSIAQDIVYAVSNRRKLTPKHIGLGLALHQATRSEAISGDIPLVSLASKDSAPTDVVSDLLRAEERGKLHVITNVKQRLIEKTVGVHDVLKKHRSKTFATLYKATVSTKHNAQKTVKADRKFLQRLLNVVTVGRTVEMGSILKHELSPVPLSLAKHGGDMNSTQNQS